MLSLGLKIIGSFINGFKQQTEPIRREFDGFSPTAHPLVPPKLIHARKRKKSVNVNITYLGKRFTKENIVGFKEKVIAKEGRYIEKSSFINTVASLVSRDPIKLLIEDQIYKYEAVFLKDNKCVGRTDFKLDSFIFYRFDRMFDYDSFYLFFKVESFQKVSFEIDIATSLVLQDNSFKGTIINLESNCKKYCLLGDEKIKFI